MVSLLAVTHVLGLALAVGAATVKLALLLRCRGDATFVPVYLAVVRLITRFIILGMILLTVSGVGWIVAGYGFTPVFVMKLVLVGVVWVLGPVIDNVAEPAFRRLAPAAGEPASAAFLQARARYLALEASATGLFYIIILIWMLT